MYKCVSRQRGFTLIEIIVGIVILGIMAVIAMPKFVDLREQAKITATQKALDAIRSTLNMQYAARATAGNPSFPNTITAADFESNKLPINQLNGNNGVGAVGADPGGTATHGSNGFWFIVATGIAGAYSDGTVDTGNW